MRHQEWVILSTIMCLIFDLVFTYATEELNAIGQDNNGK